MTPRYSRLWLPIAVCALFVLADPARASFFDVFLESWSPAPPYPTSTPVRFAVLEDLGAGPVHVQTLSQGLLGAGAVGGGSYSTLCTGSDASDVPGFLAPDSFFDVFLESVTPTPPPGQRVSSFFDVFTEITWSAGQRGQLVTVNDAYPVGDARRYIGVQYLAPDSFFDIFLEMVLPEAPGSVIRYEARYSLGDAVVAAGGQLGGEPVVILPTAPDSFFDIFLEISIPGSLPAGTKALTVTTTAARVAAPVSAGRTTWGALKSLYR